MESIPVTIEKWSSEQEGQNLVSVVQFGSSLTGFPKLFSDLDVLFVFKLLPERRKDIWKLVDTLEDKLEPVFIEMRNLGFYYSLSPIIRSLCQMDRFSYFYLDLPELNCLIWGDKKTWAHFIQRILTFRANYQAEKVSHRGQVAWNLSKTLAKGELFDPEF